MGGKGKWRQILWKIYSFFDLKSCGCTPPPRCPSFSLRKIRVGVKMSKGENHLCRVCVSVACWHVSCVHPTRPSSLVPLLFFSLTSKAVRQASPEPKLNTGKSNWMCQYCFSLRAGNKALLLIIRLLLPLSHTSLVTWVCSRVRKVIKHTDSIYDGSGWGTVVAMESANTGPAVERWKVGQSTRLRSGRCRLACVLEVGFDDWSSSWLALCRCRWWSAQVDR